jgi:hypothetical protein
LNLDLSTATQFRVTLLGEIAPDNPLGLFLSLADWHPFPAAISTAFAQVVVTQPGEVVIPMSAFVPDVPGLDPSSIDDVSITISACLDVDCAGPFPSQDDRDRTDRDRHIGPNRRDALVLGPCEDALPLIVRRNANGRLSREGARFARVPARQLLSI